MGWDRLTIWEILKRDRAVQTTLAAPLLTIIGAVVVALRRGPLDQTMVRTTVSIILLAVAVPIFVEAARPRFASPTREYHIGLLLFGTGLVLHAGRLLLLLQGEHPLSGVARIAGTVSVVAGLLLVLVSSRRGVGK